MTTCLALWCFTNFIAFSNNFQLRTDFFILFSYFAFKQKSHLKIFSKSQRKQQFEKMTGRFFVVLMTTLFHIKIPIFIFIANASYFNNFNLVLQLCGSLMNSITFLWYFRYHKNLIYANEFKTKKYCIFR